MPRPRMSSVNELSSRAWATRGWATKVPRPWSLYVRPSAVSRSISPRTVILATPKRSASSRSDGSSLPGGRLASSPSRIARTCAPFGLVLVSRRGSRAPPVLADPGLAALPRRAI